jgi:alkanesulfonate monooxygenase SsuD/methylene tetrahydromethanopterin reductase-like flavin-dependent oxidoreductase (luciferase family)
MPEALGFARYWLAEHHNMAGIASSATAVLVGHIAGRHAAAFALARAA